MHFALPPRKSDRSPPYAAAKRSSTPRWLRRGRATTLLYLCIAITILFLLVTQFRGDDSKERIPAGTPHTVIVTAFDEAFRGRYERMITDNRKLYARLHNYALFLPNKTGYDLGDPPPPSSWAKIPAMRHALATYPHSEYFFYVDQHALIMRPELSIEEHLMSPLRLKDIMLLDTPVVPPDSIIKTAKTSRPEKIDAVFTQDHEGLGHGNFVLRRGEWAKFFLDAWFDPLYRSYNFQRAEAHALEHLVQWHGTVLTKIALVPQRVLNAYTKGQGDEVYQDGDFVANFHGCDSPGEGRDCEKEAEPLVEHLASLKLDR